VRRAVSSEAPMAFGRRHPALPQSPRRISGLPNGVRLIALVAVWVVFGFIGHDPWKPGEAHYFGIGPDFLQRGDRDDMR